MSNELAPPPTPTQKRSFPWWVIGCGCSGCLIFLLLAVGAPVAFIFSGWRVLERGSEEEVRTATYEHVVANTGPPPGYQVVWGNAGPWPFLDRLRCVVFVPVNIQGDVSTQLNIADTFGVLFSAPESEDGRAERDRMFDKGMVGPTPGMMKAFELFADRDEILTFENMETGTLSGHRFPLRYVVSTFDENAASTREPAVKETGRRGRNTRRRPMRSGAIGIVDLTPPDSRDTATILWLMRKTNEPFTPDFLSEFCRNFRPGQ